jgi:8-oxo-dGTP diphosphatase
MRTYLRVGAIIFHGEKLLTTKMKNGKNIFHVLPGGGVEEGETIYEAIKREVKEELNIEITKFRLVYIKELNIKDKGRGVEFYFYVEEYKGNPVKGIDPEEKETTFDEICFLDLKKLGEETFHPEQLIPILMLDKENNFNEFKHLGLHNYP